MSRHPRRPGAGERRFRIIVTTLVLVVALSSVPAMASGPGLGWMGDGFNVTDSNGIHLFQYQMSMDDGGVTAPLKAMWASIIGMCWNTYLMVIALLCRLLDWTVAMSWVGWITGPLVGLQNDIHDKVLAPLGADSWGGTVLTLLTTCAGVGVVVKMMRGRTAGAWATGARAAIAAALALGFLAAPVANFAGDTTTLATPLARTQQFGVALSHMITSSVDPATATAGEVEIPDDMTSRRETRRIRSCRRSLWTRSWRRFISNSTTAALLMPNVTTSTSRCSKVVLTTISRMHATTSVIVTRDYRITPAILRTVPGWWGSSFTRQR